MNKVGALLIACLVISLTKGTFTPGTPYSTLIGDQTIEQTTYFFRQKIDHFDPSRTDEYNQKFTVYDTVFNPVNGTVIIYIGGEASQSGLDNRSGWILQVAQQLSAMVILVEHRFYGVSQPFGFGDDALSVDHLRFLTVDQSLADLAYFITFLKTSQFLQISQNVPFLAVGGSYAGAMSAWFRYKYPHLTVGALASSAVVNSILEFQQYDYQFYTRTSLSNPQCPIKIQKFNEIVEDILNQNGEAATNLRALFNAQKLEVDEFLSYFGDLWAGMVQYGKRTDLCKLFTPDTFDEQLKNVVDYAITKKNQPVDEYITDSLKITKYVPQSDDGRQWAWQTCTELGWFQTANQVQPMRSNRINVDFYKKYCNVIFEGFSDLPHSDLTNTFYGGKKLQAFNIVFTNGADDPWQWVSIRYPQGRMDSIISDCVDCGHCAELHLPKTTDPSQLQQTRAKVLAHFQQWIRDFYAQQVTAQEASNFVQQKLTRQR